MNIALQKESTMLGTTALLELCKHFMFPIQTFKQQMQRADLDTLAPQNSSDVIMLR